MGLCVLGILLGRLQDDARRKNRRDVVTQVLTDVTSPVSIVAGRTVDGTGRFFRGITTAERLTRENDALRQLEGVASLYAEQTERLTREIESLRRLQGLPIPPGKTKVMAEIIGYAPSESRITLNKGQADGISPGCAVVSGDGMMAMIQTVGPNVSQGILLTALSAKFVGVDLSRNPMPEGIVQGLSSQRLSMIFLDPNAPVEVGDTIATSGHGPKIPRGLVVGKVIQVENNAELGTRRAVIDPAFSVGETREVAVLK